VRLIKLILLVGLFIGQLQAKEVIPSPSRFLKLNIQAAQTTFPTQAEFYTKKFHQLAQLCRQAHNLLYSTKDKKDSVVETDLKGVELKSGNGLVKLRTLRREQAGIERIPKQIENNLDLLIKDIPQLECGSYCNGVSISDEIEKLRGLIRSGKYLDTAHYIEEAIK
jgi:hypothetical protein